MATLTQLDCNRWQSSFCSALIVEWLFQLFDCSALDTSASLNQLVKVQVEFLRLSFSLHQVLSHTESHVRGEVRTTASILHSICSPGYLILCVNTRESVCPVPVQLGRGVSCTIHVHQVPHSAAKATSPTCGKRSDFRDAVGREPEETKTRTPKHGRCVCL